MTPSRLFVAALVAASCSGAGAAVAADGPLAGTSKAFEDAVRRGDTAALGAMYAADGEILPPNGPRVRGPGPIGKYYGGMIDAGLSLKVSVDSEVVDRKLAYKSGSYLLLDKQHRPVERGKWVEVWRQDAGKWRMVRDIWNSDAPPPPPPTPRRMAVPPGLTPRDPALPTK